MPAKVPHPSSPRDLWFPMPLFSLLHEIEKAALQ